MDKRNEFFIRKARLRREVDSLLEPPVDVLLDRPRESLFERLLCVLHALLGSSKPSWLKSKAVSKPTVRAPRDIPAFDNEAAVGLQVSSMLKLLNTVTCLLELPYLVCIMRYNVFFLASVILLQVVDTHFLNHLFLPPVTSLV